MFNLECSYPPLMLKLTSRCEVIFENELDILNTFPTCTIESLVLLARNVVLLKFLILWTCIRHYELFDAQQCMGVEPRTMMIRDQLLARDSVPHNKDHHNDDHSSIDTLICALDMNCFLISRDQYPWDFGCRLWNHMMMLMVMMRRRGKR